MKVGVCRVLRESLGRLVGVGAQVCVCSGSSRGKARGVYRRAVLERGGIFVVTRIRIDLRRVDGFVWFRGSQINVSLIIGMGVAIHDAMRTGERLEATGLVGSSGRVRRRHGPVKRTELVTGGDRKRRGLFQKALGETT